MSDITRFVISFAVLVFFGTATLLSSQKKFIALLNSPYLHDTNRTEQNLKKQGCIIHHRYPPHVLKGVMPDDMVFMPTDPNILLLTEKEVEEEYISQLPKHFRSPVDVWNNSFLLPLHLVPSTRQHLPPLRGDCLIPNHSRFMHSPHIAPQSAPSGAGLNDTSEYMIGIIALTVILPESTGTGSENWTQAKETEVQQKIEAGGDFWINQDSRAHLSFTYTYIFGRTDTRAQVSVEPITLSGTSFGDEYIWINEIMDNMGYITYSENEYFDQVRHLDRDMRDANEANWAVTVFVADSEQDNDGSFSDGSVAYAYIGGPFLVMTYDNALYTIDNMDYVFSHELAHSFWALDEYYTSYSAYNNQNTKSGYLDIINGNFENYDGTADNPCIMRTIDWYSSVEPICTYTQQQVGWRDSDGDGVFNIVDTLGLTIDDTVYFSDGVLKIIGTASSLPAYTNSNSYKETFFGYTNDITILTIAEVAYRLDNGSWMSISSAGNPFDESTEIFETAIQMPQGGFGTLTMRTVDSLGNNTTVPVSLNLIQIDNNNDFRYSVSTEDLNISVAILQHTFSEDTFMLINSSVTFPKATSNAAILNPTGIGANISISTTEKPYYPITLTFTYEDAYISGMEESHIGIAYYDEDWDSWVPLSSTVREANKTVSTQIEHFSYFQVMERAPSTTVDTIKPYPNPFNVKKGHTYIVFSNLTAQALIKVYTLLGELVTTIEETDGDGLSSWDVTNHAGKKVASGTYIYRVTGSNGGNKTGRIIIIR